MSYVDQHKGPSAAGLASSIIVQLSIGAAVIAGLSVTQFAQEPPSGPIRTVEYPLDPPPPPPPPEPREAIPETPVTPLPYIPPREFEFKVDKPDFDYTDVMPDPLPPVPQPGELPRADPEPLAPVASFTPVSTS